MDYEQYLTAKDLMNFVYCPRIAYFELVMHAPQATTKKEYEGRKIHGEFSKKSKRTMIIPDFPKSRKEYGISLTDPEMHLRTIIDCLILETDSKTAYPVQVKNSAKPRFIYRGQRLQLIAEAHLVEKALGYKVPVAYIKYLKDGQMVKVSIDDQSRNELDHTIKQIKDMITTEVMPEPTKYRKKCADCCFINLCKRD